MLGLEVCVANRSNGLWILNINKLNVGHKEENRSQELLHGFGPT